VERCRCASDLLLTHSRPCTSMLARWRPTAPWNVHVVENWLTLLTDLVVKSGARSNTVLDLPPAPVIPPGHSLCQRVTAVYYLG
jgi:hypothetical protein